MNIDPLSVGDSPVHRIDPRVRLTAAAGFSVVAAVSHSIPALAGALAVASALASLARLRPAHVAARLSVVNGLVACIWILVPFTTPGEALFRVGPFAASRAGVDLALLITLKTNAIVLCFMALVATMAPALLGHALHRLQVPDKLVLLFLLAYRYIFVLEHEYQRLVRAARIRGFRPGTNVHTYRTYAYLVGMLFVRAAERAERVHWAMRCRGFRRKFYCLQEFRAGGRDVLFAGLMGATVIALAAVEFGWR
jgi:cobalt/nickel transport system permease protein